MGNSPAGYHQAPEASNHMLGIKYIVIHLYLQLLLVHNVILIFSSIRTHLQSKVMLHVNIKFKMLSVFVLCGLQRTLLSKPMLLSFPDSLCWTTQATQISEQHHKEQHQSHAYSTSYMSNCPWNLCKIYWRKPSLRAYRTKSDATLT